MRKTLLGSSTVLALAILIVVAALAGCSKDEPALPDTPEALASFDVAVPSWVRSSTPFSITVTAVGNRGSSPLSSAEGTVALSVPQGTISPSTMALSAGVATSNVQLIGAVGSLTVTASLGNVTGMGTIGTVSPDSIAGASGNLVAEMIPDIEYFPRSQDFTIDHPDLIGAPISHNTIVMAFTTGTTIGQANQILNSVQGAIVGGLPGINGVVEGVAMVRLPTVSHAELSPILATLQLNVNVESAFSDAALRNARIPRPNLIQQPYDWGFETTPSGGNWGLELTRVPQMWNLDEAIKKTGRRTKVGVLDHGFPAHVDLDYFSMEAGSADHGAMVSGIVGALFSNELGIDGVSPYADITVGVIDGMDIDNTIQHSVADNIQSFRRLVRSNTDMRVLVWTTCYGWCESGVDASISTAAKDAARTHGEELKRAILYLVSSVGNYPMIVTAAGNDSNDGCGDEEAKYASPWNNAGLDDTNPKPVDSRIIVVEAIEPDGGSPGGARRASFSNLGGHISAPGVCVRSTAAQTPGLPGDPGCDTDGAYKSDSGTSFAAPHVAGLIASILVIDPSLPVSQIRDVLLTEAVPVGGGAANRMDAWATVLDIDRVMASNAVLRMVLDVDDGTPDGNQRVDANQNGVSFDAHGDGNVDMSDFRRWRDWYLQIADDAGLSLDGGSHAKKDPNGNGVAVEATTRENTYPRADFNGDGKLDPTAQSYVPGSLDATVSDVEALQRLFADDNYNASELPGLVQSGDVTITPAGCLSPASPAVIANSYEVVSSVTPNGSVTPTREITHSRFEPVEVFTVVPGQYQFALQVRDGIGGVVAEETSDFLVALGGDIHWEPGVGTTGCVDTVAVRDIVAIPISGSPGNHGLANLGDFDGDGVVDLARIGSSTQWAGQRSIYFMFLNANGTLKEERTIEAVDLGYDPEGEAPFKTVACLGDVDKDGVPDIGVGIFEDLEPLGAIWIIFLNADATIKGSHKIRGGDLGCASCNRGGGTNWIAPVDDLNNDGTPDVAVAWGNDAGSDELVILYLRRNGELRSVTDWGPLTKIDNPVAAAGDLDNDGSFDLAYAWSFFFGSLRISFLNTDGSEKTGQEVFSWPSSETILSIGGGGDIDGDNIPDALVTTLSPLGSGSNVWAMLLNTDGTLKNWLLVNHPGEFIWGATVLGDIDADSASDIAILDQSQGGSDTLFVLFGKP